MSDYLTILEPLSQETLSREITPTTEKTSALIFDSSVEGILTGSIMSGEFVSNLTIQDGYLQSSNYVLNSTGWKLTPTSGEFNFAVSVDYLDIPDTTTANSFHVDVNGNAWWGATAIGTAVAKILNTGEIYASVGTIEGTLTIGGRLATIIGGAINADGDFINDLINARIDTEAKTILNAFTFGASGAIQIGTYVNGVSGDIKISPSGIVGRNSAGNNTFTIDGTTGSATFAGTLSGASGTFGTITAGTIEGTLTIGGRLATTIGGAINIDGNFINNVINTNLDTSAKTILGDFTFGASGAIKMITDVNNGLWISPTGILGKKAGTTTFAIDISGNATFAGTLSGASGTFGTITAGTITTDVLIVGTNVITAENRFNTPFTKQLFTGNFADGLSINVEGDSTVIRLFDISTLYSWSGGLHANLYSGPFGAGQNGYCATFDNDMEFMAHTRIFHTSFQDIFWGVGDVIGGVNDTPTDATSIVKHFGFFIQDGTLYASNGNATNQTKTNISAGLTLTNWNTYRIVHDADTNIKFYVNDVLKATHTTNRPSGGLALSLSFSLTAVVEDRSFYLYNNYLLSIVK